MKCSHCGVENAEEARYCAICGNPLTQAEPEKPAAESEESPVLTEPEETTIENETPEISEAPTTYIVSETNEKKSSAGQKTLLLACVLLAAAVVVMAAVLVRQAISKKVPEPTPTSQTVVKPEEPATPSVMQPTEPETQEPVEEPEQTPVYPVTAYHSPALVPMESMDTIVGKFYDREIDNRELNYYYWEEYEYLLQAYSNYITALMDPSAPLGEQKIQGRTDGYTWQDFLLEGAVNTMREIYALRYRAEQEGYELPQSSEDYLAQTMASLQEYANTMGYAETADYLRAVYGCGSTEESFEAYLRDTNFASDYAQKLYNSFTFTDEEISTYYDTYGYADSGLVKSDERNVNVRHILIMPADDQKDEDWQAAEAEAERIYALWNETPTEEQFAALAGEYSEDPGSQNNGGLYESVARGEMVQPFNDWCFDETRQIGDTGIVKTSYGYHIMYFSGKAEHPAWMDTVLEDMRADAYQNAIAEVCAGADFQIAYERVVLAPPNGLYE